jgi:hypothetical protein
MSKPRNPNPNKNKNDFVVEELIKDLSSDLSNHSKDMISLSEKIKNFELKFGNNEKIAETLFETSKKAVKMQEMLADNFIILLKNNIHARKEILNIINEFDRDFTKIILKRFGFAVWSILMVIIGAFFTSIINKFF